MTKETCQLMRAINYGFSMQDFIIIYFCKLEDIFSVSKALESTCTDENVEVAVCGITPLSKGLWLCLNSLHYFYFLYFIFVEASCTNLLVNCTIGLVLISVGDSGQLNNTHANYFAAKADKMIIDKATSHILYEFQKPVCLYKELIELFSMPGDWVFSGPTGIGMYCYEKVLYCINIE